MTRVVRLLVERFGVLDGNGFVGMTALLDAFGKTIDETGARLKAMSDADRPGKIVVAVMTDGQENSSTEYTQAAIQAKVKHQTEKYKWEFVYLGANVDAKQQAAFIGVVTSNAMNYASTPEGVKRAVGSFSSNVGAYRQGGATGMSWSPQQEQENSPDKK